MAWTLHVEGDAALTVAQATALKAAVTSALAGLTVTQARFTSDHLPPGNVGDLLPPAAASISRQASDGTHTAIRN